MNPGFLPLPVVLFIVVILLASAIRVLREYERGVIFRLGRLIGLKGPGLILLIPMVDKIVKVSLRTLVMDVPPQDVITKDNVTVKVNAVIYSRVIDPRRAVVEVEDYHFAISQISQTTLRSVLGEADLDALLSGREKLNQELQTIIDAQTEAWGVKVIAVELKDVLLPEEMRRAMAKQAEAERERRAKIINADGEFQASMKLTEAAQVIEAHPMALQLRYLQTLAEIATENNSTTVFPIPIEFLRYFERAAGGPVPMPGPMVIPKTGGGGTV
jgi:regulator of protease activity HflC (stomatin/prohibitin superfamily)